MEDGKSQMEESDTDEHGLSRTDTEEESSGRCSGGWALSPVGCPLTPALSPGEGEGEEVVPWSVGEEEGILILMPRSWSTLRTIDSVSSWVRGSSRSRFWRGGAW